MATYIMSDIHGCYDKFTQMLKKINFTKDDRLIINGDIFDRGKDPLKILDYVVSNDNVIFIPGNHEYMFLEFYATGNSKTWFYNGGYTTYNQICKRGQKYADSLYNWLSRLDLVYIYGKFIITHAGLYLPENQNNYTLEQIIDMQDTDYVLWSRSQIGNERRYKDYTIINGHTPTLYIDPNQKEMSIIKQNGTIYTDCGAVFDDGRLACLRLDDMKEFYI